jgi:predicted Na+-dependent transporter
MQLGAIVFIIPWKTVYMFRVPFTPIIRSVLKLYMQLLVQSHIGMLSDPVCYKMVRSRERRFQPLLSAQFLLIQINYFPQYLHVILFSNFLLVAAIISFYFFVILYSLQSI